MSQTCPNCGSLNRAANRFCSNCGGALVPSPSVDETTPGEASSFATPATPVVRDAQPVTYKVQTWNAPEGAAEPVSPGEERVVAPPRPMFVPYGIQSSTLPAASQQAGSPTLPAAPVAINAGRTEGGMYSPYSADAARKLESQKSNRTWLLPSLGAAALLLLVLVAVGAFLLLSPKTPSATNNTPGNNSQAVPSGSGSVEDTIKNVIRQSNDEQITAWHNLDISVLNGTRTGQVLQDNIQAVQDLRSKGMYAIPVNKSLEFGDVKITGDTATASTVEVWTVTFYSQSDNKVVLATGPDTLHETYHLVKQNGKWLVSTLDIVQDQPPATKTGTDS